MLKGIISNPTAVTAGALVPFGLAFNTNNNTGFGNNAIQINAPGYYDIFVSLVVTGVAAGNITAQLYDNGVAIPGAIASGTSAAATDLITLNIPDVVRVRADVPNQLVRLTVELTADATVNSGSVIVQKVR